MDFFVILLICESDVDDRSWSIASQCKIQIRQCAIGIELTAFALAGLGSEMDCWQNSEIGFHGLEVFEIGVGNIMTKSTKHGGSRKCERFFMLMQARGGDTREQTRGDVAHVTFVARDLTCEDKI